MGLTQARKKLSFAAPKEQILLSWLRNFREDEAMRRSMLVGVLLLGLGLVVPVLAQQPLASNPYFFGANPQNLTFTPINVTKMMTPVKFGASSNVFYKPPQPKGVFDPNRFFPKISLGT